MQQEITACRERVLRKLFSLEAMSSTEPADENIAEQEKRGLFKRDFGMEEWDWPQGVGLYGLAHSPGADPVKVRAYIKDWYERQCQKGLPARNINTTVPLLTLMDYDFGEKLSLDWMSWLEKEAVRTREGGLQHVTTGRTKDTLTMNPQEIWIDTLFMTNLFMGKMGIRYKNRAWQEESIYQILVHIKYLLDKQSGLFYHGWTFTDRNNFSEAFWARGNSWFTLGIPLFLNCMRDEVRPADFRYILQAYQNQVQALLACIDPHAYMWHTLLDDPDSYLETSGSSAILAGIFYGMSAGLLVLDKKQQWLVDRSLESLLKEIDINGEVHDVSAGTPIGATKEAYKAIIKAPMAYGQALMLVLLQAAEDWKIKQGEQLKKEA